MASTKEIAFTSEQQFDRNIHEKLIPQLFESIRNNDVNILYDTVLSLFIITKQFYRKAAPAIKERIYSIELPSSKPLTVSQKTEFTNLKQKCKLELLDIWGEMFDELDKIRYFKRQNTIDSHHLAVQTK